MKVADIEVFVTYHDRDEKTSIDLELYTICCLIESAPWQGVADLIAEELKQRVPDLNVTIRAQLDNR